MLYWLLFIIFVIVLLGALPIWPYSRNWGFVPSSLLGVVLLVILLLLLL